MGVPRLKGYINNDEKLDFIAYISTTENFEDDFTCSGELDEMIKTSKICNRNCKEEKREESLHYSSLCVLQYLFTCIIYDLIFHDTFIYPIFALSLSKQ